MKDLKSKIKEWLQKLPKDQQEQIVNTLSDKDKIDALFSKPVNKEAVPLTSFEVSLIPTNGILINKPGTYSFTNDIVWNPSSDIPAISINCEGVILDFDHYSLRSSLEKGYSSSSESFKGKHYAIHIYHSQNVIIKNARIFSMGLHGIVIDTSNKVHLQNIEIEGLNNEDYTVNPAAILGILSSNIKLEQCMIHNISSIGVNLSGIQLNYTENCIIKDCEVDGILNNDGVSTGVGCFLSDKVKFEKVEVYNLRTIFNGKNFGGHTCIGFFPFLSEHLQFVDCKAERIEGSCDDAHGFSMFLCENVKAANCSVNDVSSGKRYGKCAKATGIEIYGSKMEIENCKVKKIHTFNPENRQCTGFSVASGKVLKLVDCEAEDVRVFRVLEEGKMIESSEAGYGYGYGWAPDPRKMFIKPAYKVHYYGCKAKDCQVGFDTFLQIDSTWEKISSKSCGIPLMNFKDESREISCDPCSECPDPLTSRIKNISKGNVFLGVKISY